MSKKIYHSADLRMVVNRGSAHTTATITLVIEKAFRYRFLFFIRLVSWEKIKEAHIQILSKDNFFMDRNPGPNIIAFSEYRLECWPADEFILKDRVNELWNEYFQEQRRDLRINKSINDQINAL